MENITKLLPADLFRSGLFRTSWLPEGFGAANMVTLEDGWSVILDHNTVAAEALYRIADAIDVVIPYEDLAKGVLKNVFHNIPSMKDAYVSYPSFEAMKHLAEFVGMDVGDKTFNPNTMTEVLPMTDDEERLHGLLVATLDGHCAAARLVHQFGWSGRRTQFNDHFLPTVPFIIHDKKQPVRLLGHVPHPKLHNADDQGRFIGIETSESGNRCLLEFVVSEQSVEGNSFNVSVAAKEAIAGRYTEVKSGIDLSFSLERKNARKFSGMGRVVRNLYPDYMAGQTAWVVLDKDEGKALVELHESNDYDARDRMRDILAHGIESANQMTMAM